ncbi:hypothetical protein FOCC_FOCC008014 [Frankliniella occidentalis]|nr:hypothetical protein FOCC_FOCC008014 [Frankliniella occidentalis]
MATLSLKISIVDKDVTKTMKFDPSTSVFDACRVIREKISEANFGQPQDYGLFLADEDVKKGVWLEPGRNLEYYILRNGDLLEYRKKLRTLRVRMLDGTLKTMLVDDSQPVANLMVVICTKIGITNHDEYSLVRENMEEDTENQSKFGTLTLKRKKEEKERDAKMEQLRKKLKTDDEVNWIDPGKTLREQGIDESEAVLLRRKFFFSDQNIDSRDPVQLNLLYVQARDAILDGTHPVTQEKACEFAGIQCHIQFGDHNEQKHKPPFLDLKEFLPQSYCKQKGIEKKIFAEHRNHVGISELDAKVQYTKTARALKTYGVTFFLVKEKMKGKNKLVPRLLGVTKDSVLRLDERTKEILKTWPLTTVRRWGASPNTFTLDFGDYSDQYYSVQTTEAEQIQQLIAGYIDIILKKKKSKDHFGIEGDEGSTMVEDSVSPLKATILQHESSKVGRVNTESVAKPAIMRAGADGKRTTVWNWPYRWNAVHHYNRANQCRPPSNNGDGYNWSRLQQGHVTSLLSEPQQALLSTINTGQDIIVTVEKELIESIEVPDLGSDPVCLIEMEGVDTRHKQAERELSDRGHERRDGPGGDADGRPARGGGPHRRGRGHHHHHQQPARDDPRRADDRRAHGRREVGRQSAGGGPPAVQRLQRPAARRGAGDQRAAPELAERGQSRGRSLPPGAQQHRRRGRVRARGPGPAAQPGQGGGQHDGRPGPQGQERGGDLPRPGHPEPRHRRGHSVRPGHIPACGVRQGGGAHLVVPGVPAAAPRRRPRGGPLRRRPGAWPRRRPR